MKRFGLAVLLAVAVTPAAAQDGKLVNYKELGSISDSSFRAIEAAMPELRRQHPDWQDYRIDVSRMDQRLIVSFCPKKNERTIKFVDGAGGVVASVPRCPGSLSVERDKDSLEVVAAHHNRD